MKSIDTVPELRKAIKNAKAIYVRARFGVFEQGFKISKKEAQIMTQGLDENETPQNFEMGTDSFATLYDDGDLWLGV